MGSHIIDGEFQSDKYPTCPRGKVPLSVKDKTAQDLLWEYAQRRRSVDAGFSRDLESALVVAGHVPVIVGSLLDRIRSVATLLDAAVATALKVEFDHRMHRGHRGDDDPEGAFALGWLTGELARMAAVIRSIEVESPELHRPRELMEAVSTLVCLRETEFTGVQLDDALDSVAAAYRALSTLQPAEKIQMKIHKITLLIIDTDNLGAQGVTNVLENSRYSNHSIGPQVMEVETREVEWSDEHPLNNIRTQRQAFAAVFAPVVITSPDWITSDGLMGTGPAPEGARLTLSGAERARVKDAMLDPASAVKALGDAIGFGQLMQLAVYSWSKTAHGHELSIGPCAISLVPCPCPESGRDKNGHCEWCCGSGQVTKKVRGQIAWCEAGYPFPDGDPDVAASPLCSPRSGTAFGLNYAPVEGHPYREVSAGKADDGLRGIIANRNLAIDRLTAELAHMTKLEGLAEQAMRSAHEASKGFQRLLEREQDNQWPLHAIADAARAYVTAPSQDKLDDLRSALSRAPRDAAELAAAQPCTVVATGTAKQAKDELPVAGSSPGTALSPTEALMGLVKHHEMRAAFYKWCATRGKVPSEEAISQIDGGT